MPNIKKYSDKQVKEWYELRKDGMMYSDISKLTGIPEGTLRSSLSRYRAMLDIEKKIADAGVTLHKDDEPEAAAIPAPVKEKTLSDFSPRDMLKHLYNLGYRLDEKGIYFIKKERVNLQSVINE